ncbi:MAG: hypothetical protein MSC31_10015 [Solirubrobacteraceae bacterium MAG38_C4-C5]|nr:hypothetical protein [Candidatus Siliceabacter maunaloa]
MQTVSSYSTTSTRCWARSTRRPWRPLGTMHLARVRVAVRRGPGGTPQTYAVDPHEVRRACVEDALAHARGRRAGDAGLVP